MIRKIIIQIFLNLILFMNKKSQIKGNKELSKILIIRLDEIGDVVLTTPLIKDIRKNNPKAFITLIVKKEVYNLVQLCPYVDEVKFYEKPKGRLLFVKNYYKMKKFISNNSIMDYDLAIIPRYDFDWGYFAGLFAYLTHARRRVGYSENETSTKRFSDYGFNKFYTDLIYSNSTTVEHEMQRNIDILFYLKNKIYTRDTEIWVNEDDILFADKLLHEINEDDFKVIVCLSTSRQNKDWGIDKYVLLFSHLYDINKRFSIILIGAGKLSHFCAEQFIKKYSKRNVLNLTNKTTLRETYAILKKSDLYIGSDTGPLHMAATAKIPGIAFYANRIENRIDGLDTPERFGPWNADFKILQPEASPQNSEMFMGKVDDIPESIVLKTVKEYFLTKENLYNQKV